MRRRRRRRNPTSLTSWGPGGVPTPILLVGGLLNVGFGSWTIISEWQTRKEQIAHPCEPFLLPSICDFPKQDPSPFMSTLKNSPWSDAMVILGTAVLVVAAVR